MSTKVIPKSHEEEHVDSDKLTDLSQESDILVPSKSEFSLAPQHINVNSQDNEIVLEIIEEKDDNKGIFCICIYLASLIIFVTVSIFRNIFDVFNFLISGTYS